MSRKAFARAIAAAVSLAAILAIAGTAAAQRVAATGYTVQPLVSDQMGNAPTTDAKLINPWGIVAGPTTPWWVANNVSNTSTVYNGAGQPFPPASPLVVSVPRSPTGTVFNGGSSFLLPSATGMSPARFIFATQAGQILGWNGGAAAQLGADRSPVDASYTGLAIAGNRLFAADFHNRRVDMFDGSFHLILTLGAQGFFDRTLPPHYSPFGIQNVGGHIFVAYAQIDDAGEDEVPGPGLGIVDEYDTNGKLLARVASHGELNAPWGITMAPASGFGPLSGTLVVGNFGDGHLNGYAKDASGHWMHVDQLRGTNGDPIEIEGLWGIGFGNGGNAGPTTSLFFAAGVDDETHGLFGAITAAS